MAPIVIRYPLDPTGTSPNNLVQGEEHDLGSRRIRAFATSYGGFFTESIILKDKATDQILDKNTDYYCAELYTVPTEKYGKEICSVVVVTNESVSNEVVVSYQALGGPWSTSQQAIIQMFDTINLDDRPVTWGSILNKPTEFNPTHHLHDVGDVYGFEYIVAELERIYQAILLGDVASHDEIYRYIDNELGKHLEDFNNPHRVTAEQLGVYTKEEIDQMFEDFPGALVLSVTISGPSSVANGFVTQITANASLFLLNQTIVRFDFMLPDGTIVTGMPGEGGVSNTACRISVPINGNPGETVQIKARAIDNVGNVSRFVEHNIEVTQSIPVDMTNFVHNIPGLILHNTSRSVSFSGVTSPTARPLSIELSKVGIVENVYTPNTNINVGSSVTMAVPVQTQFSRILTTTIAVTDKVEAIGTKIVQTEVVQQFDFDYIGPNTLSQNDETFTFPATGRYRVTVTGGGGDNSGGGGGTAVILVNGVKDETANLKVAGRGKSSIFTYKTTTITGNPGSNGLGGAGGTGVGGTNNYTGATGQSSGSSGGYWTQVFDGYDTVPQPCAGYEAYGYTCNPSGGYYGGGAGCTDGLPGANGCRTGFCSTAMGGCTTTSKIEIYPAGSPGQYAWFWRYYTTYTQVPRYRNEWVPVYYPAVGGSAGTGSASPNFPSGTIGKGGDESSNGNPGGIRITYLGSL